MNLAQLKEAMQANPTDAAVGVEISRLAFGDSPNEKQIGRARRALQGSIDAAMALVDRVAPGRVVQIVCSQYGYPSAAISPVIPFPEDPPMHRGFAPTAGQAILLAMLEAMIQELGGDKVVEPRPRPGAAHPAPLKHGLKVVAGGG